MKVILLQDVARIGKKHEVKEVPTGHALNYLVPHKLAAPATAQNIKSVEARAKRAEAEASAATEVFVKMLEKLGKEPVVITASANEKGHLFQGLHEKDIAGACSKVAGIDIVADSVTLSSPIKELGEHTVVLKKGAVEGEVTISVTSE